MNVASTSAPHWAVSTHTDGEVLTAGVTGEHVDLVLLAIPAGFTSSEIEGWLRDLAGVALETSRSDVKQRAIPSLLHHTLTGLLFSHAELWSRAGVEDACSAAFIETPDGASFGWVGTGAARVRINGRDYSPQWVHVRDEEGREARAAMLPPGVRAEVTIEHWPGGRDAGRPPVMVEAEWAVPVAPQPAAPASESEAAPASPEPPAAAAEALQAEAALADEAVDSHEPRSLPESLPLDQPGLIAHAQEIAPEPRIEPESRAPAPSEEREPIEAPKPHPVARWLGRVMNWGRREEPAEPAPETPTIVPSLEAVAPSPPEPVREEDSDAPVSQYDLLLSSPEEDLAPEPRIVEPEPESEPLSSVMPSLVSETGSAESAPSEPEASPPTLVQPPSAQPVPEPPAIREGPPARATPPAVRAASTPRPPIAPAGLEDILGQARPWGAPSPAQPAAPRAAAPSPSPAADDAPAQREVPEDVSTLPTLSVPLPEPVSDAPIHVEHEPVGAHREQFAIAPLPADRTVSLSQPTLESPLATGDPHAELLGLPWLEPDPERDRSVRAPGEPAARRAWPAPAEEAPSPPRVTKTMVGIGAALVVLFGAGWLVGSWQDHREGEPSMVERALRVVGLGAPRFNADLQTEPPGAWVSVDGREMQRRTPVQLELPPGEHQITFSMPDLGEIVVPVSGRKGETIPVKENLHGSLEVIPSDASVPIQVSVDRKPLGYAPVSVESIEPGLHEVMFSGPGMPAWAQTVQVGIRRTAQVVAHPMTSPATGVLQVQASLDDEQGSSPLSGAQVYVDGELKGATPLSTELSRGPHSIRVEWRGEVAPVQVIDLPGGNQRFATFAFGLEMDQPVLKPMNVPRSVDSSQPAMVSAVLDGMSPNVIREAWLHVRTSEGLWRRSAMSAMRAPKGVVLTTVFPTASLDDQTQTRWYMSAVTLQGDEYFTEMQRMTITGGGKRN